MTMTVQAVVVKPNGRMTIKQLDGWKGIQAEVDGRFLELVPFTEEFACCVDEKGIAKGLRRNQVATDVVRRAQTKMGRDLMPKDFITGTAVFVGRERADDPEARIWDTQEVAVEKVPVDCDLPQSVIDEYFVGARIDTPMLIQGFVYADDRLFDATWDATPWFVQAGDEELVALARINFGKGDEADAVVHFAADESQVARVLEYCQHTTTGPGPIIGITTEIDPNAATKWLKDNRSHLLERLENETK